MRRGDWPAYRRQDRHRSRSPRLSKKEEKTKEQEEKTKKEQEEKTKKEMEENTKKEMKEKIRKELEEKIKKELKEEVKQELEEKIKTTHIWTRSPDDISTEEYGEFYKSLNPDGQRCLALHHFDEEGQVRALLFIPNQAPKNKRNNIKLYVKGVFIKNNFKEVIPEYLNFVEGVVDCEESLLNISREVIQQNKILKVIREIVVKKVMEMIEEISKDKDKFKKFYEQFSENLKLGIHEDSTNRKKLARYLRYSTSASGDDQISLTNYITRMEENQKDIYYITGESKEDGSVSAIVERLKKRGIEVVYMTEPSDEYVVQQLKEFDGKNLVSITKGGLKLPKDEKEKKKMEADKEKFEGPMSIDKGDLELPLEEKEEKMIEADKEKEDLELPQEEKKKICIIS